MADFSAQSSSVEYTVVCNKFLSDTVNEVNDFMKRGWKPVGGIHSSYQTEWAQALIRSAHPTPGDSNG